MKTRMILRWWSILVCGVSMVPLYSQDTTNTVSTYFGGLIGISSYTLLEPSVPVQPFRGTSAEVGFSVTFLWANDFAIRTGLEYTYFRSPFVEDTSRFQSFIQVPIVFQGFELARITDRTRILLSGGPKLSLLAQYGLAGAGDSNYNLVGNSFGQGFKTSLIGEIALFHRSVGVFNSFGIRISQDLPGWSISQADFRVDDRVSMGTLFMNFNIRRPGG